MAVVPALPTVVGGVYTSSQVSQIVQVSAFLLARPAAELRQATTQSIPDSTWTSLSFDTEDLDSAGGHDNVTNNSRYTAQYAGWYLLGGGYNPNINGTGIRGTRWMVNGTAVNASGTVQAATSATGAGYPSRMKRVFLNVGDYVELQVFQSSTAPLGTQVTGDSASSMSVIWDRNA